MARSVEIEIMADTSQFDHAVAQAGLKVLLVALNVQIDRLENPDAHFGLADRGYTAHLMKRASEIVEDLIEDTTDAERPSP